MNSEASSFAPPSVNLLRARKRKLDDAIYNLDEAVGSSDTVVQPPPQKKAHVVRSLYSTLAKYGIKTRESTAPQPTLPQRTPHLSAIVSRAASRARKAMPFRPHADVSVTPHVEYRPSSIPSFLSRLSTFKIATYANKPTQIDAVAASKCGWTNDGRDRLVCGICQVSWVVSTKEGLSRDAVYALVEKQRVSLVEAHKTGCPWKTQQCDESIYRIPLKAPVAMARDIKLNAVILDTIMSRVDVRHPLSVSQTQTLCSAIASVKLPSRNMESEQSLSSLSSASEIPVHVSGTNASEAPPTEPSTTAVLASLFGWTIAPPAPPRPPTSRATSSISRARSISRTNSAAPSSPLASTTPRRLPSKTIGIPTSASVSGSITCRRTPLRTASTRTAASPSTPRGLSTVAASGADTTLLHCVLCQRRVGMWAFAPTPTSTSRAASPTPSPTTILLGDPTLSPMASISTAGELIQQQRPKPPITQRPFDLLKEHRAFCPYVVKSSILPTIPVRSQSSSAMQPPPLVVPLTRSQSTTPSLLQRTVSTVRSASFDMNGASSSAMQVNLHPTEIEGWKALLTVIARFGSGQRSRMGLGSRFGPTPTTATTPQAEDGSEAMAVDGVEAMMATVKARGGRELLKYVKGLLG